MENKRDAKITLRKCIGCNEMKDAAQLIRISCDSAGSITIDAPGCKKKSPGRGAYLCRNENCLAKTQKTKGMERSFKRAIPKEIYAQLKTETN